MKRSMLAVVFVTLVSAACAQTSQSQSPPGTSAPVTSAVTTVDLPVAASSPAPLPPPTLPSPSASASPASAEDGATSGGDAGEGVDARFRACRTDADCVAVPRAGCCHNGWKEAVAVSHADDYAQANACTRRRPVCPMYIVRDVRIPKCAAEGHLCTMVRP